MSLYNNISAERINDCVKNFLEENKHLFRKELSEDESVTIFYNAWKNGFYLLKDSNCKNDLKYISSKGQLSLKLGYCSSICYGNKTYITLVFYDGKYFILHSKNSIEWDYASNNFFTTFVGKICYGNSMFVAFGRDEKESLICYSRDGNEWCKSKNNLFSNGNIFGICRGKDKFVAVGNNNDCTINITYSYDGVEWIESDKGGIFNSGGSDVCWGVDKFVAVGDCDSNRNTISYSYDGILWNPINTNPFKYGYGCVVCWGHDKFVAIGTDYTDCLVAYSMDGISWISVELLDLFKESDIKQICWGNGTFVAVGGYKYESLIAYSRDGINWSLSKTIFEGNLVYGVCWADGKFYASGQNEYHNTFVIFSDDGVEWKANEAVLP